MAIRGLRWLSAAVVGAGLLTAAALTLTAQGSPAPQAARSGPPAAPAAPPSPTTQQKDLLHRAEQLLIRDCMAGQGFRYWPAPRLPSPEYREFPYVVDDEAWAAEHGYGREFEQGQERRWGNSEGKRYLDGLSKARKAAYTAALFGPSADRTPLRAEVAMGGTFTQSDQGCTAAAWRRLYGDVHAWYRSYQMVNSLPGIRVGRVAAEPEFQAGLAAWRSCMRESGYRAENPPELRRVRLLDTGPGARAADVRAATAEARCARTSGLAATAERLDEHHKDVLYGEHRSAFDTARRMQRDALPTARDVVGRG
ncbi:hypothetical protein [Streptomyces lavendofoliae]|uniref:hypothetical protein n=1 Tax=Streptomyces lavendofoliae TaxID=67314 RepID=UPI003D8AA54C